ncbi:hypothetical protein [Planktotalea sp.]|uniref:hypothetical protein n=1 Tax=Planktotalea sp. TaxID=2029877 RepID=UPI003299E614
MPDFNNMTIVAASEVIEYSHTQNQFSSRATQWGVDRECGGGALLSRTNALAQLALNNDRDVYTPLGTMALSRAMVEHAIGEHPHRDPTGQPFWTRLIAGLRLDGFEVCEEEYETGADDIFGNSRVVTRLVLRRMLPDDVPSMDVRAVQSELETLLIKLGLTVAKGHLDQCIAAFSRGDWAASNAQLRSCFEAVIHGISERLGNDPKANMAQYLKVLGEANPAFLYPEYNEWHLQDQKPQFIKGLWARLHPEGSHPGLSEEDDCTFRLQIVTITLRLLLRRLDARSAAA